MAEPDWQRAHQEIQKRIYGELIRRGIPHSRALVQSRAEATKSSERAINKWKRRIKTARAANPQWSDEKIHREALRLDQMTRDHKQIAGIRLLVDGKELHRTA